MIAVADEPAACESAFALLPAFKHASWKITGQSASQLTYISYLRSKRSRSIVLRFQRVVDSRGPRNRNFLSALRHDDGMGYLRRPGGLRSRRRPCLRP